MKKLCLSLGAILLSGVVLASCSNGVSIKKPKKGSSVEKVEVDLYDYDYKLEISKDDSFEDVYEKLSNITYMTDFKQSEYESEFAYKKIEKSNMKSTYSNYYLDGYVVRSGTIKTKEDEVEESYGKNISTENKDVITKKSYYYKTEKGTEESKGDDMSLKSKYSSASGFAGEYVQKRVDGENRIDFGSYEMEKNNITSKSNSFNNTTKEKSSVYKYLNDREKDSDPDYRKEYSGRDSDGKEYSYRLTSVFDQNTPDNQSLSSFIMYSKYFEEHDTAEYSFELTDKYIILKSSINLTASVSDDVRISDFTSEDEYYAELVKLSKTDYKGSKVESEFWINYTNSVPKTDDEKILTLSYATLKDTTKFSRKKIYDDAFFNNYSCPEEFKKEYKGKEYTVKGKGVRTLTIGSSLDEKYDKKITSFKKKAKKNNVYKKIDMTYEKEGN